MRSQLRRALALDGQNPVNVPLGEAILVEEEDASLLTEKESPGKSASMTLLHLHGRSGKAEVDDWRDTMPQVSFLEATIIQKLEASLGRVFTDAHRRQESEKPLHTGGIFYARPPCILKWHCPKQNRTIMELAASDIQNMVRSGELPVPAKFRTWDVGPAGAKTRAGAIPLGESSRRQSLLCRAAGYVGAL